MARTLNAAVFVDGQLFRPGDDVPEDVAKRIGDHAWTDGDADIKPAGFRGVADPVEQAPDRFPDRQDAEQGETDDQGEEAATFAAADDTPEQSEEQEESAEGTEEQTGGRELPVPPRSGKGSGIEAWRAYARSVGVEPSQDADRDDIIAAVDAHRLAQRAQQ